MHQPVKRSTQTAGHCYHCGEICRDVISFNNKRFCCEGCRTVYNILSGNNMDAYYCLNEMPGNTVKEIRTTQFDILKEPKIASGFISFQNSSIVNACFFLPQIHCSSCLWLLENLKKIQPAILSSQVNFASKEINVTFDPGQFSLYDLAVLLTSVGYEPFISVDHQQKKSSIKSDRSKAYKLGIAGFCFANIMLISFPEYLGMSMVADKTLSIFFRYVNLLLSLPVLLYCGQEFFINGLNSLRQKFINIDAPVALAISVTFLRSCYEVISNTGSGYFDSMSGIIFFMLMGRLLQNRMHTTLQFNRDFKAYFPIAVKVVTPDGISIRKIQDIKTDDVLRLQHQEVIPVDGLLSSKTSLIDYSFITGESTPALCTTGSLVYAGGRVHGDAIELIVVKPFSQNSFTQLWNNDAFAKDDDERHSFVNTVSRYFAMIIILIAASAFIYWKINDPSKAWNALTAVLIIACPCTLLLTASFTNGYMINIFSRFGLFVKNAQTLEKMTSIDHIIFDKTGTLTAAKDSKVIPQMRHWSEMQRSVVLSIMSASLHPLSNSIVTFSGRFKKYNIDHLKEIPGSGVEAWFEDVHYKIGSAAFADQKKYDRSNGSNVFVTADEKLIAHFIIENDLKPHAADIFKHLQNYQCSLLSGDDESARAKMEKLFPGNSQLIFRQTPQQKLDFVKQQQLHHKVMMVGDGLNDAGALKQSDAGIAIADNAFSFSPACDAVLDGNNIDQLGLFLKAAKSTQRLIMAGFGYSLLYNIAGLYIASTAQLAPMVAAIIMPLSSLGIILIAFTGTKWATRRFTKR